MKCEYCSESIEGDSKVLDEKLFHSRCADSYTNDKIEKQYPYVETFYDELMPYLSDTKKSDKWVIIRSEREHGCYGVLSVDSEQEAISIVLDPGFDCSGGYTDVDIVYHDGRQMEICHTVVLK